MPGGKGKIHEHPNANSNGFKENPQNINKNGRDPSIKKLMKEFLTSDDSCTIWVTQKPKSKKVNGKTVYGYAVTSLDGLILRLDQIIRGKNDRISLDAIKFIWEQIDGKARQSIKTESTEIRRVIGFGEMVEEEEPEWDDEGI